MDYAKLYNDLISFRKSNPLVKSKDLYTEKHHIVPKCLGGSNSRTNLVRLAAREHFIAHRLLVKIYPEEHSLQVAVWGMMNTRGGARVNSREFHRLKELFSEYMKERWKEPEFRERMSEGRSGENNPMYGRTRENCPSYGVKWSEERKQKLSEANMGKKLSNEHKQKLSEVQKSKFLPDEYAIDDPKHFFWERADELMYAMSRAGVKKVYVDFLRSVFGEVVQGDLPRKTCVRIAKRITEYGWNPLVDDRWLEYTRERFELTIQ